MTAPSGQCSRALARALVRSAAVNRSSSVHRNPASRIKAITAPDPANPTKTIITGWRWYNTGGDWITYNKDGRITGYGDRNNIQVSFDLDSQSRPVTIKDHFGAVVLTFTYTANKLTQITDRATRQVQYGWTGNDLTQVTDVLTNVTRYEYAPAVVATGSGVTGCEFAGY